MALLYSIFKLLLTLCSGFAFVYGVSLYFKKHVAMFNQLIVCAMGCIMLGRLFSILQITINGHLATPFNVGMLGSFGGFMFLFSAAFGQMDGLVDGHQPELKKYRLAALLAPMAIIAVYVFITVADISIAKKIVSGLMMIPMLLSSYYNLKQYIIPDVEYGILDGIRHYNMAALVLCILSALEILFEQTSAFIPLYVCETIICAAYVAIIPILKRGSKKWTI